MGERAWCTAAAALALGWIGLLAACRSDTHPEPGDAGFAPASPATASSSARIAKDDCRKWADHATEVVVGSFEQAASDCPPQVRDSIHAQFDGQRVSIREAAVALCTGHVGETYAPKDAACVMAAASAEALVACRFAPLTSASDSDWTGMIADLRRKCGVGGGATPPSPPPRGQEL